MNSSRLMTARRSNRGVSQHRSLQQFTLMNYALRGYDARHDLFFFPSLSYSAFKAKTTVAEPGWRCHSISAQYCITAVLRQGVLQRLWFHQLDFLATNHHTKMIDRTNRFTVTYCKSKHLSIRSV